MPTVTVSIDQQDYSSSRGQVRDHALIMDRPEAKGGQNKGPMGGETMLMGLGGCFMSNLLAAAIGRDIKLENAHVDIAGELAEEGPSRYVAIHMKITADCDQPEQMEKLVTIAERGCIAANTLGKAVDLSIEYD